MRNNRKFPRWVKLVLEQLENREAPSVTPWITDSFEGTNVGSMPVNWSQYNSDGTTQFTVTASPTPALSSSNSFSVESGTNGRSNDVSRAWLNETMPADVQVSAAVYVDSLIPAQVIARGSYLNTSDDPQSGANGPSFYAVELASGSPGPVLTLVKDVNGSGLTTLATIQAPTYINDDWLEVTLDVEGSTVRAQLFDPTTDDYLYNDDGTGQWQSTQAWALTVIDNSIAGPGMVGLGRAGVDSYTGTVAFDDFSVQTPATVQSFDATPVGVLPDNWISYTLNPSDSVAVASPTNPTAFSGPNALAITPYESSDTDRAWLNTVLPGDLSVSAYTYADTLTPAQVFARGSDLASTSPNYYAVEVSRGLTVSLVKVVNGTQTVLGSVTSTDYLQDVWVQETLGLSGSTLEAQIYQPDTQQYLNSSGGWQSTPTWVLTETDTSLPDSAGQTGVARPVVKEYVETDYFDDFTTATGMDTQDFDFTPPSPPPPAGSLITGWSQYSSNGTNYFSVVNEQSSGYYLSAFNALVSGEMANTIEAAAWDTNAEDELTNAQVTAAVYMTGTMPTLQLVARGLNLKSSTPSYYGLSFTESGDSGPELDLVRVNDGGTPVQLLPYEFPDDSQTELPTDDWINTWVQETLYVDGDNVRASIYRTDTGQYLNSDGQWQVLPTYAVNLIDPDPLTQAGFAGIVRPSGSAVYAGYLDNFAVAPVSVASTPPSVTVSAPSGTLSGTVTITATPTEPVTNYSITQVAFYLDDNPNYPSLSYVATAAPYTWDFDTNSLSNGTHTLLVVASDNEGNIGETTTTITVSNNTTLSMPSSVPAHPNTVGITELDYGNTDADPTLVENDVDVVIGGTEDQDSDVTTIHDDDSSVQQLVYTNVSNIALGGGTSIM